MKKPLKPCKHPGCRVLTAETYCADHQPARPRKESAEWHYLYTDRAYGWASRRAEQLRREPFCRACAVEGLRVRATDVDHIVPHCGDVELFVSGELQSLCHRCHSRKTMREMSEKFGHNRGKSV